MGGEPERWRTFGAREIYQSPELWLGQIDVELPGGERVWEHVVRLHQTALMALLDGAAGCCWCGGIASCRVSGAGSFRVAW